MYISESICISLHKEGSALIYLQKKIVLNIPTPVYLKKENYEEGVIYTYIFKDGGCILIHEGALMQFDLDSYKPLKVTHKKTCFYILWNRK